MTYIKVFNGKDLACHAAATRAYSFVQSYANSRSCMGKHSYTWRSIALSIHYPAGCDPLDCQMPFCPPRRHRDSKPPVASVAPGALLSRLRRYRSGNCTFVTIRGEGNHLARRPRTALQIGAAALARLVGGLSIISSHNRHRVRGWTPSLTARSTRSHETESAPVGCFGRRRLRLI